MIIFLSGLKGGPGEMGRPGTPGPKGINGINGEPGGPGMFSFLFFCNQFSVKSGWKINCPYCPSCTTACMDKWKFS